MKLPLLTAFLFLAACSSVTTSHPIGAVTSEDLSESFNGAWQVGEEVIHVRASAPGHLRLAAVEWKDDHFELNSFEAIVSEHHGRRVLSLVDPESSTDAPRLSPSLFHLTDEGHLVGMGPNFDAFAQAVEEGLLRGTAERSDSVITVVLTGAKQEIDAALTNERLGELFDAREPGLALRLTKE